jgi:hypothetical protein
LRRTGGQQQGKAGQGGHGGAHGKSPFGCDGGVLCTLRARHKRVDIKRKCCKSSWWFSPCPMACLANQGSKRKAFFFEKKKQKTFEFCCARGRRWARVGR